MPQAASTVTSYIAAQSGPAKRALSRVRATIRKALPGSEEVISYRIPAFRVNGRVALWFAGWAKHYSLYPVGEADIASFKGDKGAFELRKATLRFPLTEPVPEKFIAHIAKVLAETRGSVRMKAARKKAKAAKKRAPNSRSRRSKKI